MTPREVLIAAKAMIPDEAHWWRGWKSGNPTKGCHCPLTAMGAAAGTSILRRDQLFEDATAYFYRIVPADISSWNDAPERTLAEIHAAFDRAIALAAEFA